MVCLDLSSSCTRDASQPETFAEHVDIVADERRSQQPASRWWREDEEVAGYESRC